MEDQTTRDNNEIANDKEIDRLKGEINILVETIEKQGQNIIELQEQERRIRYTNTEIKERIAKAFEDFRDAVEIIFEDLEE